MSTNLGSRRPRSVWVLQAAFALTVAGFVIQAVVRHWDEFRAIDFPIVVRPLWVALAAAVTLATYATLVAAWRAVILGWGQRLRSRAAFRIWTVSNLGRYLPGKVWSVAGLAVLAQREGVAGWAAVGAAIAMQAIAVGSGVAATAATAPGTLSVTSVAAAGTVAVITIVGLSTPGAVALLARFAPFRQLRPLPLGAVLWAGTATTAAWAGYGLAFWCLARGTLGTTTLDLAPAVGVFAAGYIAGLLALFAPGGVGVREAVFIALLAPSVGSGGAIVLTLASRILLTVCEVVAALLGLALGSGTGATPPSSVAHATD